VGQNRRWGPPKGQKRSVKYRAFLTSPDQPTYQPPAKARFLPSH
jgi:hypothetical protein